MARELLFPWGSRPDITAPIADAWKGRVLLLYSGNPGLAEHSGGILTPWGVGPTFTVDGLSVNASGSGAYRLMQDWEKTGSFTWLVLCRLIGAPSNYSTIVHAAYDGGDNDPYGDQIDHNAGGGTDLRFVYNVGGGVFTLSGTGAGISTTAFEWVAFTYKSGEQKGYKNGVEIASDNRSGGPVWSANSRFTLGQGSNLSRNPATEIAYALRLNFAATAAELTSLMADRWQVVAPRRIWVPFGSAIGATAGNATAGNATAAGATATISIGLTVNASPGAATAAGSTATISLSLSISMTPGSAVAAGATATVLLGGFVITVPGNAVAAGATATMLFGLTISAPPGDAVAAGSTATFGEIDDSTHVLIAVALDGSKRRNITLRAFERFTLDLIVYASDGEPETVEVTDVRFARGGYPIGSAFTAQDEDRLDYRLVGEIAGITTTLATGQIITRIYG